MKSVLIASALGFLLVGKAVAQETKTNLFFTANANLCTFSGKSERATYPILWYDKETDAKILIGGFGVGLTALRQIKPSLFVKGQANLSKHTFWNEPIKLVGPYGTEIMEFHSGASNYTMGLTATAHMAVSDNFLIGTGLGAQVLLVSLARQPNVSASANPVENEVITNRFYKRVLPTLPVELTFLSKKKMYTIRYEQHLLSPYKKELGKLKKEASGILTFEIGFKLGAGK